MIEPHLPTFAGFLLVLFRCGSLFSVAPLFGMRAVPGRVRLGLAVAISTVAFTSAGAPAFAAWDRPGPMLSAVVIEVAIGLSAALSARMAIEALAAAGNAMAVSMGLSYGAVVDPVHGAESTSVSEILMMLGLGIAVAAGIHREAIAWLCRSVVLAPPGTDVGLRELAGTVVSESARACALAIRLAFPVMAAVTSGHLALGILTRTVPQLNVANVGFTIAILAGGGSLYLVAPGAAEIAAEAARAAFVRR